MKQEQIHPKWWILYLLLIAALGLFVLELRMSASENAHRLVEIGIVLLTYGLVFIWLHLNSRAILREDQENKKTATRQLYSMRYFEPQNPILHSSVDQTHYESAPDPSSHRA